MMSRKITILQVVIVLLITFTSCVTPFRKAQKSSDWKLKYDAAMEYYEKKDYFRAAALFEEVLPLTRGLPQGENVQFYMAYCNYHEKNYILSAHHFRIFYETYARSQKAEEAQFMHAYSEYISSPSYSLDQSSSIEAMNAMQIFLNRYPQSEYRKQAIDVIQEMQIKLEVKAFENAKEYLKIKRYKAAVIAFQNFWLDYPDSKFNEEAFYLRLQSQYLLANKSFSRLQEERFEEFLEMYEKFIDRYPQSTFLKEAEKYYAISRKKMSTFASQK